MKTESRKEVLDRLNARARVFLDCVIGCQEATSYFTRDIDEYRQLANLQEGIIEYMVADFERIQLYAIPDPNKSCPPNVANDLRMIKEIAKTAIALADAPYGGER